MNVAYLSNLTSLFPRSPITATRVLAPLSQPAPGNYSAFYGKSTGMSGLNDALHIWDRWLGGDRAEVPAALLRNSAETMPRFFGALQDLHGLPVVNKVNRLNTCAHLVAEVLPSARFVVLRRDPLSLAQSLYIARRDIVRDLNTPYGVRHPDRNLDDPLDDVCRQVRFHEHCANEQLVRLGPDTLRILSYEQFCQDPQSFLHTLRDWTGIPLRRNASPPISKFEAATSRKLDADKVAFLQRRLEAMKIAPAPYSDSA
jgi:hypothetical protein